MNEFDKIFIISYVYNSKKRKQLANYLTKEFGITNFEFIYGIDSEFSNINDIKLYDKWLMSEPYKWRKELKEANNTNEYYKHHISALLAHISTWQVSLAEGYNKILVFEDDVKFIEDKEKIIETFKNHPKDADIVHYGYIQLLDWQDGYNEKYDEIFSKTNKQIDGLQCYGIYNQETLKKFIDYQKFIFSANDQFMQDIPNINRYYTNEKICYDR